MELEDGDRKSRKEKKQKKENKRDKKDKKDKDKKSKKIRLDRDDPDVSESDDSPRTSGRKRRNRCGDETSEASSQKRHKRVHKFFAAVKEGYLLQVEKMLNRRSERTPDVGGGQNRADLSAYLVPLRPLSDIPAANQARLRRQQAGRTRKHSIASCRSKEALGHRQALDRARSKALQQPRRTDGEHAAEAQARAWGDDRMSAGGLGDGGWP
eukprot:768017-Hanusia_phi.AAC.4